VKDFGERFPQHHILYSTNGRMIRTYSLPFGKETSLPYSLRSVSFPQRLLYEERIWFIISYEENLVLQFLSPISAPSASFSPTMKNIRAFSFVHFSVARFRSFPFSKDFTVLKSWDDLSLVCLFVNTACQSTYLLTPQD
jgi:hypothetical protein